MTDSGIDQALDGHYDHVHPDVPLRGQLVVFPPGSGGRPERAQRLRREAAPSAACGLIPRAAP